MVPISVLQEDIELGQITLVYRPTDNFKRPNRCPSRLYLESATPKFQRFWSSCPRRNPSTAAPPTKTLSTQGIQVNREVWLRSFR